jgi:hypothetical protein
VCFFSSFILSKKGRVMWFGKSDKELEYEHQERMKCLEMGFPLPDAELAWVEAVRLRGGQVTAVLIVGTVALACAPVGATAILLALIKDAPVWLMPAILVFMWSVCGYLLFTLFRAGMQSLGQIKRPADFVVKPSQVQTAANGAKPVMKEASEPRSPTEAIQEGRFARQGTPENG